MSAVNSGSGTATFFKDPRVQAAISGPRSTGAALLVEEFFAGFAYDDCSVVQLLALADLAGRAGNEQVAYHALQRVIATGTKQHLAFYKMGRLFLAQKQHVDAVAQFDQGIAADPDFAYNYIGAARAQHAQNLKAEAAANAERFTEFGVRPHGNEDFTVLGDLADFLFDSGRRDRALPLYALIVSFGQERPRHVVRLAESHMAANNYAEASRMLLAQEERTGSDAWTNRALALCFSHHGDHAIAIARAMQAVSANPSNQGFIGTYVRVLGKSRDANTIMDAIANQAHLFTPADLSELAVRRHLAEDDPASAASILLDAAIIPESRLYYASFETAYGALAAGQHDIAACLAARLDEITPGNIAAKTLRIDIYFRQLRWEDAGKVLATIQPEANETPQIAMKRLEYACFAGDREAAVLAAARLEIMAETGRQFMLPVFRYLAERQDWNGVIDRAITWLDGSLDYSQIGYVLFRAAKHTRRQTDLLGTITAIPEWMAQPGLLTLRNNLAYDLVRTQADIETLARDPALAGDPAMREKLAIRLDILHLPKAEAGRQAIFLCTDRNYLCATVVALHGLTRAADNRRTDYFIVADDDIVGLTHEATRAFTDAGIGLTIVAASEIVGAAERLSATYGLFTSGHKLASAAYYRIFFALHLQQLGRHARALYVDSDIVLTTPLDALFKFDLTGCPMAARLENERPEVQRAIVHHGLPTGRYFNSGVLLLDLQHPGLPAALQAAVAAIADETVTLLYHDQCALNLGFREIFTDLDIAWNYPVGEATKLADIPPGTALLHFLDRPKPWSAAYGGEAGLLWFEKWRAAAEFIGRSAAIAVFAQIQD